MNAQTRAAHPVPARTNHAAVFVLLLFAIAGGTYAGVRWHDSLAPMLGLRHQGPGGITATNGSAQEELWTCSMHPQVIQDKPGLCPICHMQLTPLRAGAAPIATPQAPVPAAAQVVIDPVVVQNMGVRLATVTQGPLTRTVRLVGSLDEAQPNSREINLRISGWIRHLYAATEGQHIRAGDPLFDLYSPELQVAIEELIIARRAKASALAGESATSEASSALYDAVAAKLEFLGLEPSQVQALAWLDQAPAAVTFVSPMTGDITEKAIVEGAAVKMGDRILTIVDHSTLWLDARVFEQDLPFVSVGQKVTASIPSRPGETMTGEVVFIHPRMDEATRTALVRVAVPNPSLALKPGMYAAVSARAQLAPSAVLVPREAVIDTGETQICFVSEGSGRFQPRNVVIGSAGENGMVQVLQGLAPGESVVTSGQFLLDSESRLREAIQKYLNEKRPASPLPMPPMPAPTDGDSPKSAPFFQTITAAQLQKVDAVVSSYLDISATLGAEQKQPTPIDTAALTAAARELQSAAPGSSLAELADAIAASAMAMQGHPLDHQREAFKSLSDEVIILIETVPPSRALGEKLFIIHCPMAPGSWIQRTEEVANPYYASEMKACGTLVKSLATQGGRYP